MEVGDYRVLLVEDNVNDAKIIKKYFQRRSDSIVIDYAPDADRCYRRLIEHVYDLLIIDIDLPDGDSSEVVKELREIDVFAPIIMVTDENHVDEADAAVNAGANCYVTKSAQALRNLPSLALKQIEDYHKRYVADEIYKDRRFELYRNKYVYAILSTLHTRNLRYVANSIHTSTGYTTDTIPGIGVTGDRMQKVLNILTHYRVLHKTKIGMKITCPSCSSDDVTSLFQCPNCGSDIFTKTRKTYQCEGICGQRFTELTMLFNCNSCNERFHAKDATFDPIHIYSINDDLKPEITESIKRIKRINSESHKPTLSGSKAVPVTE
ncbi:response regulator [Candidatus Bathyarchaeota archaeon]|nr:response regulator [Candidatus Bathyarchaeota archaeon]